MKQKIIIGNRVDDGTGDYLRKGGQKTNDNFNELYYNLGDGNIPHAAGAWKQYSDHTKPLKCVMGQAWVVNTTTGRITVELPLGSVADYGSVIRLRDVNGTWGSNPVLLIPAGFNTVKGGSGTHRLDKNRMDVELVYCSPGNWEYVSSKFVDDIKSGDVSTVAKREYIATEGQTDFSDIFPSGYNPGSVNVYKRGNILYYGADYGPESNYGSVVNANPAPQSNIVVTPKKLDNTKYGYSLGIASSVLTGQVENIAIVKFYIDDTTNLSYILFDLNKSPLNQNFLKVTFNGKDYIFKQSPSSKEYVSTGVVPEIVAAMKGTANVTFKVGVSKITALDGYTIRLNTPCEAGDVVIIETFLDGLATYRSSYETATIRVYSNKLTPIDYVSETGRRYVGDLTSKYRFTITEFGFQPNETFNPNTLELLVNGRQLVKSGSADIPFFICEGADAITEESCIGSGGVWVPSGVDYSPVPDSSGMMRDIVINDELEHEDVITIRWFNNDIGSLLELEEILEETDDRYIASSPVNITGKIMYSDPFRPGPTTVIPDPNDQIGVKVSTVSMLFDMIHPIGTIYENADNPNNPQSYMGMGVWVRYAEGMTVAGWNSQNMNDPLYGLNNNDLDLNGNPRHSAGGTIGSNEIVILAENTPGTKSTEKALVADPDGDILVGGCQYDPDEEGPGYKKYREDFVLTRPSATVNPIKIVQPTITAHRWLRVE
ncbi:baseplate wedge protein [Aeromonas phage avDM6]|nr:baseplate wedge protein [Aeromonas phage avDM6]